jgi:hypothetical protein
MLKVLLPACLLASACSHIPLSSSDLNHVHRPALMARMPAAAGPMSHVFRDDSIYQARLKSLDAPEADRRLSVKLSQAMSRFEVGERLRAGTYSRISGGEPWNAAVSPATVASTFETFLVEDVPAHDPDYDLLRPLGADAVVEFVVEECGMRSKGGKAGAYVRGYGRMFMLEGGEIWRKRFDADQVSDGTAALDPFVVGRRPDMFRAAMMGILDAVAQDFASELKSREPAAGPRAAPGELSPEEQDLSGPTDDVHKAGREIEEKTDLPANTGPRSSGEEPTSGEIRMKARRERSEQDRGATAPGLQAPTQNPDDLKDLK